MLAFNVMEQLMYFSWINICPWPKELEIESNRIELDLVINSIYGNHKSE